MSDNNPIDADGTPPFPSPEWHMKVESDGGLDGMHSYHIDVYRGTTFMCRIALAGHFPNQAAAEEGLDRRLKAWLEDYEKRPRPAGDDHIPYDS
ncbi:hypothetical protein AB4Z46_32675 [Variovorax sp. M-6]|uniref:hypothetical protein n=1 Tax=Variovorax sp. M-6 TaxID=3233041 RepID=UPI003F97AB3B